jgi:hypothetical protein
VKERRELMNPPLDAQYIGDGAYAWFDGYQVWVATQREPGHWCCVALEPSVFNALIGFGKSVYTAAKTEEERP